MKESKYLQDNIKNIQQLFAIPALKNFETKHLGKLVRLSKIRKYESGEPIIKEGDQDQWLYFLLSGKVRVEKKGVKICTISKMGEILGEMRLLDSLSRSASVFAEEPTICLSVDTTATDRLSSADEAANLLLLLYRVLAEYVSIRLRLSNEELVKTKAKLKELSIESIKTDKK
jgi:CRP-like cAMP-binding protein